MKFRVNGEGGLDRIRGRLGAAVDRTKPGTKKDLFRIGGEYMVNQKIPMRFRAHGPGWPDVARGGSPLIDTGSLRNANDWRVEGDTLVVGNTRPQARLMNRGGDIVPKNARFLALPLSPPLSRTEARTKRPRDFAGAFALMRGPEGPGVYRKTGGWAGIPYARSFKVRGIERIFAFARKVTIKKRPFLFWGDAMDTIRERFKARIAGMAGAR